jgi:hypothetical protein
MYSTNLEAIKWNRYKELEPIIERKRALVKMIRDRWNEVDREARKAESELEILEDEYKTLSDDFFGWD